MLIPQIDLRPTVQPPALVAYIADRTGLNESEIRMILEESHLRQPEEVSDGFIKDINATYKEVSIPWPPEKMVPSGLDNRGFDKN
jgi:hypothetical protein